MFPARFSGLVLLSAAIGSIQTTAQSQIQPSAALQSIQRLPSGISVTSNEVTLRVIALRDDVLQVTEAHNSQIPEDASWAVLSAARTSRILVTADPDGHAGAGFHTALLAVSIAPDLRLTVRDSSGNILQEDAAPVAWIKQGFTVSKVKHDDDHFFGLGDKPGPLDRAGQSFVMWNTDSFGWQESTDSIYKSIPFFLNFRAGHALGVLLDNTSRTFFDFGHQFRDLYTFSAPSGPLTYYLMAGPEPKKVLEAYAWLTGPTPLPPLWSLGFQQSRYSYGTETRLMEVANHLRADKIPSDALYMDIDYQVKNRPFTVDSIKFPRFHDMIKQLARDNFHLVVITDLHIAKVPGQGYTPYDTGIAGDHFVKLPDGSIYTGIVWPGPSVFPDFTRKQTRDWWGTLYKKFAADGVSGFWNDMNEPAVFNIPSKTMPDDVQHRIDEPGFLKRTATHPEIHNVYGMENSRATYDGLLKLDPNTRPFVLTRASYAGGQRYAATWTGDNSSTWNHLRMTVPQIENLGLSGFAMSGADVGGFAGSPSPDLLTKWLEIAAFQPIDRDHAAKGTRDHEPWVDGQEHEAIRRHFIEERYKLLPYLYTMAEEMSRTGLPIMRPLFLEFPEAARDKHPIDLDAPGEFLFGSRMLVAASPSPEEVAPYVVHLPPGDWYDYWTGARIEQKSTVQSLDLEQRDTLGKTKPLMITPQLAQLPIFVRGGTILPIAPLTQSTSERPSGPLTLRVYPGNDCTGSIYQDDGKSFAYRQGAYLRIQFACHTEDDGSLTVHIGKAEGSFAPWWSEIRIEAYGWTPTAQRAELSGKSIPIETAGASWTITIPATKEATDLHLR
jgi:alpha-glucosidase